jgi:hypothetical protein
MGAHTEVNAHARIVLQMKTLPQLLQSGCALAHRCPARMRFYARKMDQIKNNGPQFARTRITGSVYRWREGNT